MPSYQEFKYNKQTGRTAAQPVIDNRTLQQAQDEKMTEIDFTAKRHMEFGYNTVLQRGRGVTQAQIRSATQSRYSVQRNQSVLTYQAAVDQRQADLEMQTMAASTNAQVDAIIVDFSDIVYAG